MVALHQCVARIYYSEVLKIKINLKNDWTSGAGIILIPEKR